MAGQNLLQSPRTAELCFIHEFAAKCYEFLSKAFDISTSEVLQWRAMLTGIAALILAALIVIIIRIDALNDQVKSAREAWTCSKCHGSGRDWDVSDPEGQCDLCFGSGTAIGEVTRKLGLILGQLGSIHDTILTLWACPNCHGRGTESSLDHLDDPAWNPMEACKTCKGTGRRRS